MADILDVMREARAENEASRARDNLAAPGLPDPDELAQAQRNARTLGAEQPAPGDATVRRSADVARSTEALSSSPRLRAWLANSASDAALARDDINPLSFWEHLDRAVNFDGAFEQGQRTVEIGRLENRNNRQRARTFDDAGPLSAAERARLATLEAAPTREYGVVGQTVEQLPQMLGSFDAAGRRAVRDVRQSWREIYGEEVRPLTPQNVIAASVLAPVAATASAISGVGGLGRGMVGFTYEQEAGAAFREFRNLRDADGNLIDQDIAGAYARDVGLINAAVEFGGLGLAAKVSGATEVAAYLSRGSVRTALRRIGYREATRRLATGAAAAGISEGLTELTQEGVTMALSNLAMDAQGGEWDRLTPDEIAERAWEAFRVGATVGAVFGSVPAGARFATDVMAVQRARAQEEIFQAISDGAGASKLRTRAPERFAAIVDAMTAGGPISEARIDAHRFAAFFQEQDIDPFTAADQLRGVGREALQAALDSGGEITMPMGTYAAQIVGTDTHAGLAPHIRMGPDQMTPAEVKARFELGVDLERATSEAVRLQGEADARAAQINEVTDRIAAQFSESGFIPQATRAYVKLYAEHIVTMAARSGVDPSVMLDRVGFTLHGPLQARNEMAGLRASIISRVDNAAAEIPRNPFPRDNFGVARPKAGLPVQAVAATDFGELDGLKYAPGDMIVTGPDGKSWPVGKAIFEDTYAATGEAGQFQKRTDRTVGHFTLNAPREIATREGVKRGNKGDVILIGQHGEMWPVEPDVFASRYESAGDGAFDKEISIHPTALRFGSEAEIVDLMQLVAMGADMETLLAHPIMVRIEAHMIALEQTMSLEEMNDPRGLDNREYLIDGEVVDAEEMLDDALRVARGYAPEGVKTDRVATMVIGNFGAGKSTFIKKIAAATSSAVVDADQVKSYIPTYEDGYNTRATGNESSAIRYRVRDALMEGGENLVIEHVGNNPSSVLSSKATLEAAGYSVVVVHIKVEADEAVRRQVARFIGGGRPIAASDVRDIVASDAVATSFDSLVAKNALEDYIELDATPPLYQAEFIRAEGERIESQLDAIESLVADFPATSGLSAALGDQDGGFNQGEVARKLPTADIVARYKQLLDEGVAAHKIIPQIAREFGTSYGVIHRRVKASPDEIQARIAAETASKAEQRVTPYNQQNLNRLLDAAEALKAERPDGRLVSGYAGRLAEETGYSEDSIQTMLSDARRGVYGEAVQQRAQAIGGARSAKWSEERVLIARLMDEGKSNAEILRQVNIQRAALPGVEPMPASQLRVTKYFIQKERREGSSYYQNKGDAESDAGSAGYINGLRAEGFDVKTPYYRGNDGYPIAGAYNEPPEGGGVFLTPSPRVAEIYTKSPFGESATKYWGAGETVPGGYIEPLFIRGRLTTRERFERPVERGGFGGDEVAARAAGFTGYRGQIKAPGLEMTGGLLSPDRLGLLPEVYIFDRANVAPRFGASPPRPDGESGALPAVGSEFDQGPQGSAVFTRDPQTGLMTSALMRLFESRDLSTPIHEFGHIFLETLRLVASDENASAQVKKDWETALDWMGVTAEGWAEMSAMPLQQATDAMRPYHEKFARGFEAYVREGKAPSMALRDVFAQFKQWLRWIYKVATQLDVTLTPEIREVFDRLLATDAAIIEAEAAQGGDAVLPREVFAGKGKANDRAYERYLKHRERARMEASEAIDKEAVGAIMAERTRQYRARERQVRKTVEMDFDARPEERAFNWLSLQVWLHEKPPEGLEPMRLSPAALATEYPDLIDALPSGLVVTDVAGLIDQVKQVRAALREAAPKRMVEVISDLGGIKPLDSESAGDVRAILGTDKAVPVRGRMKRKLIDEESGRPLDGNEGIIQALWEMGYFGTKPGSLFQLGSDNSGPRSLREVANLTDAEIVDWFKANVEIRHPNDAEASLWFKTEDALARPNVRLSIDFDGSAITTFRGRTASESVVPVRRADVKKAAQIFVRLAAVTRAWLLIEKPERLVFTGATPAHERMYRTMLRLMNFPGYVSAEETNFSANALKATDTVAPLRSVGSDQSATSYFSIVRADVAAKLNEGEGPVRTEGYVEPSWLISPSQNIGSVRKRQSSVRIIRDGRQTNDNGSTGGSAVEGGSGPGASAGGRDADGGNAGSGVRQDGGSGTLEAGKGEFFQGERPTIDEFLDLLRRDLGKEPVYSIDDQEIVERLEAATRARDWLAERGVDIDAKAADLKAQIEKMALNETTAGVDADTAASVFGFETGRDLLEALINRANRAETIATETKRRMREELGDPFADGTLAAEATLAAHNSAREHAIELELDALSRAAGGAVSPVNRAAKRIAESQIDRMTVKQVRGHEWFLGNERRQAKAALQSVQRGEMHEAQMAKYRQLVNFHLYKLARAAADEMDVTQRYFRKFERPGVRENIEKEYLDQIDGLLDQYELRKISGKETQRRLALAAWVQEMENRGLGHLVSVDPRIIENAKRMPFASMQIDDARALRDTIKNIEHIGRLKEKLLDAADKRKFQDVVAELVETMDATGPISKAVTANYSPPAVERAQGVLRKAHAEMTRMEFLFRYLDGNFNGPLWRTLWMPFARAADKESLMMHESAKKMRAIWNRYTPSERTRMFKTRIPMPDLPVGAATNYTKAELISIALNLGNAGNVRALVDGFGWGQKQKLRSVDIDYDGAREQMIAALSRVLDARDWQTVQQVWDLVGGFRDEAFVLQEDLTGVRPEAVQAVPLKTPHGDFAGGYYPLKFDRTRDRRVAVAEGKQEVQEMFGSNWSAPMTRKGHTINRVGSGGRPVKLSLTVFSEHVQNVVHDIAYRRAIIDVDRIITNNAFADKFTEVAGAPMYDQLRPWLQAIASDKVDPSATMWQFLQKMRGNVAIAAMGFKLSTALQQLTGLLNAVPMLGAGEMGGALVKLVRNPAQIAAKAQFILNRSEFMRSRSQTLDRDIRETLERMDRDDKLYPIRHNAFALIGMFDWATSSVVWTAAYDKARGGKIAGIDPGSEADAVAFADSAVRTTQSAGLNQDLPSIMRGPQVNKLLTMFFSYFSVLYNWTAFDQIMGARKGRIPPHIFMANMALIYVISPLIAEALAGRWAPREDESDEDRNARLLAVLARMPFQTVPVINGIANAVGSGFEYQLSPAQSGIGQAVKAIDDALAGRTFESENTTKRAVVAIGYVWGLPTPAAWILIDYVADKLEGEEEGFDIYEALVADRR